MKKRHSLILTTTGLVLGFLGMCYGFMSSTLMQDSPLLMGIAFAIWLAVNAAIVGGYLRSLDA